MDDNAFRHHADSALEALFDRLAAASDTYGFEPDLNAGALVIEFDSDSSGGAAKFVVSPNAPVKQIWVSANLTSYKLDWNEQTQSFALPSTGQSLEALVAQAISTHLGSPVAL